MSESPVVIVGAGAAGVSVAVALGDMGVRPVVMDRANEVVSSWRRRYERLRLNTCGSLSHLPGRPFPKGTPQFPNRDLLIEYLDAHARKTFSLFANTDKKLPAASSSATKPPPAALDPSFPHAQGTPRRSLGPPAAGPGLARPGGSRSRRTGAETG